MLLLLLTQELDAQSVCELPGPVRAENMSLVVTVGTLEDTHVLHQAKDLQECGTHANVTPNI